MGVKLLLDENENKFVKVSTKIGKIVNSSENLFSIYVIGQINMLIWSPKVGYALLPIACQWQSISKNVTRKVTLNPFQQSECLGNSNVNWFASGTGNHPTK